MTVTQRSVQQSATEALNNTEMIDDHVEYWMKQVRQLTLELDDLEDKRMKLGRSFSPWRKHHISKKMFMKTKNMRELVNNVKFEIFSRHRALPKIEYFPSVNFKCFGSTKSAYNKLLEAIKEDDNLIVGLYGMGGSGKTTLIKEVGRNAMESKLFDQVLFTTVSQTPNLRRIQGEIADSLGLKLIEETEAGRARRIHLRLLAGVDRILLILDDVWEKLNLEDIGVHQGCKILLTTRLQTTCSVMNCQKSIRLDLLTEEESWALFQHHAGIVLDKPSWLLEDVARDIARECKGLPIAIKAVGTALRGMSSAEWKLALHKLKQSKQRLMYMDPGVGDTYLCLMLSYDYLRNAVAKSLFLMCGLFPEDHDIYIEDVFRYGMGLGLCKETELEMARSQVKVGINNLIDCCLLTHSQKGEDYLKMHDIVRDVSLYIESNMQRKIVKYLDDEALSEAYAISSWYKEGNNFPLEFDAPKLEVVLIHTRNSLDLSYISFHWMKALKVFAIVNESYHKKLLRLSLPRSDDKSVLLPHLQTLRLVGLVLHDISFIESLTELEILDLRASQFNELPGGIIELKK